MSGGVNKSDLRFELGLLSWLEELHLGRGVTFISRSATTRFSPRVGRIYLYVLRPILSLSRSGLGFELFLFY